MDLINLPAILVGLLAFAGLAVGWTRLGGAL